MKRLSKGLYPVMLTPFNERNEVDIKVLEELTDFYLSAGANGLFANCLSSEMFQLTDDERIQVTKTVVDRVNGKVPVVSTGSFGEDTEQISDFIKRIYNTGVSAVIISTNQLNSNEDNELDFKAKIEKILKLTGNIPLGLYECPVPYKRLISPELLKWLGQTNRFLYHKDTSCNIDQIKEKINASNNTPFGIFNANTPTCLESLKMGAQGISPIGANFYPELYSYLFNHYTEENYKISRIDSIISVLESYVDGGYYPLLPKIFLNRRGLNIKPVTRTPVPALQQQDFIILDKMLSFFLREANEIGIEVNS